MAVCVREGARGRHPPLCPLQVRVPSNVETAAAAILTDRITPIVCISNVTGEGLDLLRLLLSHLPGEAATRTKSGSARHASAPPPLQLA